MSFFAQTHDHDMLQLRQAWQAHGFAPVRKQDLPAAAELLARAFESDPLIAELLPGTGRPARLRKLRRFYRIQMQILSFKGVCVAACQGPQMQAVLAFLRPGQVLTLRDEIRSGGLALLPMLSQQLGAALDVQSHSARLRQQHGPTAWYLALAGVSPTAQRQGWLRRGMAPLLEHAAQSGAGLYLETQNPHNVAVYQRLGLHLLDTQPLEKLPHLRQHAMRTPAAAPARQG